MFKNVKRELNLEVSGHESR